MPELAKFPFQVDFKRGSISAVNCDTELVVVPLLPRAVIKHLKVNNLDGCLTPMYVPDRGISSLTELLMQVKKLESFEMKLPRIGSEEAEHKFEIDTNTAKTIAELISKVLLFPAFSELQSLTLALPSTWHFECCKELQESTRNSLKEIAFIVTDGTGPDGCSRLSGVGQAKNSSKLTKHANNAEFAKHLFTILNKGCPNLESLSIVATHLLDLKHVRWSEPLQLFPPPLRQLRLSRVQCTTVQLKNFWTLCRPPLKSLCLDNILIHDVYKAPRLACWAGVFDSLKNLCPSLQEFYPSNLQYDIDHAYYEAPQAPATSSYNRWGDEGVAELWTISSRDRIALHNLKEELKNRYYASSATVELHDREIDPVFPAYNIVPHSNLQTSRWQRMTSGGGS